MIYLVFFFLAIYLTIALFAYFPKIERRFYLMIGIHLSLTVPSAYFLAKSMLHGEKIGDTFLPLFLLTLGLVIISIILSGIIVRKIK